MSLKRPKGLSGTLVVLEHSSSILKGNPLGDPHVRKVGVWLPPQYDEGLKRRFPVLYDLVTALGRDYKNVHTDVQALIELGLLEKDERGGLRAPFDEIVIRAGLRKAA